MNFKNSEEFTASIENNQDYRKYYPIFTQIKKLAVKNKPTIIAIDGRCGSGKSFLSSLLIEVFRCNVFHMDDFFLPIEMRTSERLAEPGANVHYERFRSEVILPLMSGKTVNYRSYMCGNNTFDDPITVDYKNLNIIEGVYSMHPSLREAYDYSIFLTVDPAIQLERIRKRNGKEKLQDFINKWIPFEEQYFSSLKIQAECDLVFDTSKLW